MKKLLLLLAGALFMAGPAFAASNQPLGSSTSATSPQRGGDATTGLYTAGVGKVDIAISGVKTMEVSSGGVDASGSTGSLILPTGTVGQRPTPTAGMIRYNSTATPTVEGYVNGIWQSLSGLIGNTTHTTTYIVAQIDMNSQLNATGTWTLTIPAISTTVFPANSYLCVNNEGSGSISISSTPTINLSTGNVTSTTVGSGGLLCMVSNGTSLDASLTSNGNGSSQWTTSGSNIYYQTGSVSIGTNSPVANYALNVVATSSGTNAGGLQVSNTNSGGAGAFTVLNNSTAYFRPQVFGTLFTNSAVRNWTGFAASNGMLFDSDDTASTGGTDPIQFTAGGFGNAIALQISPGSPGGIAIGTTTQTAGTGLDVGSWNNSMLLPSGTSAQRPSGVSGMLRYNSTVPQIEAYYSGSWNALGAASAGITLTTTGTSGAATLVGTVLNIPQYTGGGSGTVNSGTSGQMAYYASSTNAVSGNANATISSGALTLGVNTSVAGSVVLEGGTSGAVTLAVPATAGTGTLFQLPSTNGSNTNVLQTDGSGHTSWVAAGGGGGGTGGPVINPTYYTSDTAGNLFPYVYTGAGGNASPSEPGWGVVASLGADVTLQMRFQMPSTIPGGTFKLVSYCLANATSGVAKYTPSDGMVAGGSSPSAATLTADTQVSQTWSAADVYVVNKTTLSATPSADNVSIVAVVFNHTGWTLAQIMSCRWVELWE